MKMPIIVNNFGDIIVFDSLHLAEISLEPIDIVNGEYTAYDAEGRLLHITPHGNIAKIELAEIEPLHASELREALITFFKAIGLPNDWLSKASLGDLVIKALYYKD